MRNSFLALASLLAGCLSSAVGAASVVPGSVRTLGGHYYLRLTPSSWQDAEAAAVSLGGHLATINSAAENSFVRSRYSGHLWIGLNDVGTEAGTSRTSPNWRWASGETLTATGYRGWGFTEPTASSATEDYVFIYSGGEWLDHTNGDFFGVSVSGVVELVPPLSLEAWEIVTFAAGEVDNTAITGPLADPDGDGLPNLLEYALGLPPKTANAQIWEIGTAGAGNGLRPSLSFGAPDPFPPGIILAVEAAATLGEGSEWTPLATRTAVRSWTAANGGGVTSSEPTGGRASVAVRWDTIPSAAHDQGFLRLRAGFPVSWGATVAVGYNYTLAIKPDGSLWQWGSLPLEESQTTTGPLANPVQVGLSKEWRTIDAEFGHIVGLTRDGTLWAWGWNEYGELGDGTRVGTRSPVRIGAEGEWRCVAAGLEHTVALKADGSLWAWGRATGMSLGQNGQPSNEAAPIRIGEATDWQAVTAGGGFSVAIKQDGSLWAWGSGTNGKLGVGTGNSLIFPTRIGSENDWRMATAGGGHALALKTDGSLWAWGDNRFGQLGDDSREIKRSPVRIGEATDWEMAAAGGEHTVARKTDGSLWTWGRNQKGQLGDGTAEDRAEPGQVGDAAAWQVVAAGIDRTVVLSAEGSLWGPGSERFQTLTPAQIGMGSDWLAPSAGGVHTLAIKSDGSLHAWGDNYHGQLGNDATTNPVSRFAPVQIGAVPDWQKAVGVASHSVALKADGSLWAWGKNQSAQLGDGTTQSRPLPKRIGETTDWRMAVGGWSHSVALKTDGSLWAWGTNQSGQLGNGTSVNQSSPVRIGVATDWRSLASAVSRTVALKTNGTLWTWGGSPASTPVQLGEDTDWAVIATGEGHTMAIKTDGTLWAWGGNSDGQLGDGTRLGKSSPVRIGDANDWQTVAGGNTHTVALKTDGSLWAWGTGFLGDGPERRQLNPWRIGDAADWAAVSAGSTHTIALKKNGTLWGWGNNQFGQVGASLLSELQPGYVWGGAE